jgi:PKD repeat protein
MKKIKTQKERTLLIVIAFVTFLALISSVSATYDHYIPFSDTDLTVGNPITPGVEEAWCIANGQTYGGYPPVYSAYHGTTYYANGTKASGTNIFDHSNSTWGTELTAGHTVITLQYVCSVPGSGQGEPYAYYRYNSPLPVSSFTGIPLSGAPPLTVSFNDTSINNPTSWLWFFGDGSTATTRNVTHTYQNLGLYTVRLEATNNEGTNDHTEYNYISVTDVNTDSYTLTAIPDTIIPGQNISVTLATSSGNYSYIANLGITCWPGTCYDTAGKLPAYQLRSGIWYQRDDNNQFTINKGAAFPVTNLVLTGLTTPGENEVKATIWETNGLSKIATDTVNVLGTGQYHTIKFQAVDDKFGAAIHSATIHLKPASTGIWNTRSFVGFQAEFQVQDGEYYTYYATATGYLNSTETGSYAYSNQDKKILMRKIVETAATNTTLDILVNRYGTSDGLEGVLVRLSDGMTKTTQYSGAVTFTVLRDSEYDLIVSKTGYQTRQYHIVTNEPQQSVSVFMFPVTQATPAPVVTDSQGNPLYDKNGNPIVYDEDGNKVVVVPTLDTRTNAQKGDSVIKIIYDNAESIVWALLILFFIGCAKMALKGWKFW